MFPSPRTNIKLARIVDFAIRLRSNHRQLQAHALLSSHHRDADFIERVLATPHQRRALCAP
jgi:hypothetical protein